MIHYLMSIVSQSVLRFRLLNSEIGNDQDYDIEESGEDDDVFVSLTRR